MRIEGTGSALLTFPTFLTFRELRALRVHRGSRLGLLVATLLAQTVLFAAPPSVAQVESEAPSSEVVAGDTGLSSIDGAPGDDSGGVAVGALDEVDLATLFAEAKEVYDSGSYDRSVAAFERLLRLGPRNASAQYNLGNALLRNGELGRAIAAYRRARLLAPRDQDVLANLAFARTSARDALASPDAGPVLRTLAFWHYAFGTGEKVWLAVLANALLWLTLGLRLLRPRSGVVTGTAVVAAVVLVAMVGSLAFTAWRGADVGVVVPQEVDVRAAPQSDGVVRFKLHAGTEVRLVEERGDWVELRLPDDERGWLEREHLELTG